MKSASSYRRTDGEIRFKNAKNEVITQDSRTAPEKFYPTREEGGPGVRLDIGVASDSATLSVLRGSKVLADDKFIPYR